MGTTLTYQGVDVVVEVDDHAITLRGTTAGSRAARGAAGDGSAGQPPGGAPVVIPRWEVEQVTVRPASLLAYGRLVIATRAGAEHTVAFTRDSQERFDTLAAIIG